MKAAIRRKYGSPSSIQVEEIDPPVPTPDQLLVRVHATTVNRTDCANLTAKPFFMRLLLGLLKPKKIILGTDFAGEVVAVGAKVRSFQVQDRICGFSDAGLSSQAEYLTVVPNEQVFSIPEAIRYPQAAASLEGAHYAYSCVHRVQLQSGQKVLINGATGGIGSALLQFVRQYEVEITATCDTKNIALIQSLGADKVLDYTQEDFTQTDEQYDYVFDAVGKSTFGACKPILKKGGAYLSSELGPYGQNLFLALFTTSSSAKQVIFPIPFSPKKSFPFIQKLLEEGKFNPVIDRSYPLDSVTEAYQYVIQGLKTGNVILDCT